MNGPLQLDYQRAEGALPWGGVALLAVSLAALGIIGFQYARINDLTSQWEVRAGQIERQSLGYLPRGDAVDTQGRALMQEVKHANEVLRRLSLPWEPLFQAVESCGNKEVALLAMEPDLEKRVVKISGEAKNLVAMLDYIRRLEAQAVFGTVYLQNHQVQLNDPEKPVRFALLAMWRG